MILSGRASDGLIEYIFYLDIEEDSACGLTVVLFVAFVGVDDETGEPLIRRTDDEPEAVQHRLAAYNNLTKPVQEFYMAKSLLTSFDGSEFPQLVEDDRRSEAIYQTLSKVVQAKLE